MHKRRFSHLSHEEEQEDEWELEASISAIQAPSQPDPYSNFVVTLDKQYEVLSDTSKDLEVQLSELQTTLQLLEKAEQDLTAQQEQSKQEYLDSVDKTVTILHQHEKVEMKHYPDYFEDDIKLSKGIEKILAKWKVIEKERMDNREITDKHIEALARQYRYNEYEIMDLAAQIEGSQAQLQLLNHDISKLNSLPLFMPGLRSDIERYQSEIRETLKSLEQIGKDIKPYLIELSKLKISAPLYQDEINNTFERMSSYLHDLEKISDLAFKQRAYQALLSFVYQTIEYKSRIKSDALHSFTQTLEKQVNHLTLHDEITVTKDERDIKHLDIIKILLDDFFESKNGLISTEKMSLADRIHKLKKYEATLQEKWDQDIQSCLDAVTELDTLRSSLSETLYGNSRTSEDSIMTPESYAALQAELESCTNELKTRILELEKEIKDPDENSLFEKRKKLFSVFYTDPDEFLGLINK